MVQSPLSRQTWQPHFLPTRLNLRSFSLSLNIQRHATIAYNSIWQISWSQRDPFTGPTTVGELNLQPPTFHQLLVNDNRSKPPLPCSHAPSVKIKRCFFSLKRWEGSRLTGSQGGWRTVAKAHEVFRTVLESSRPQRNDFGANLMKVTSCEKPTSIAHQTMQYLSFVERHSARLLHPAQMLQQSINLSRLVFGHQNTFLDSSQVQVAPQTWNCWRNSIRDTRFCWNIAALSLVADST